MAEISESYDSPEISSSDIDTSASIETSPEIESANSSELDCYDDGSQLQDDTSFNDSEVDDVDSDAWNESVENNVENDIPLDSEMEDEELYSDDNQENYDDESDQECEIDDLREQELDDNLDESESPFENEDEVEKVDEDLADNEHELEAVEENIEDNEDELKDLGENVDENEDALEDIIEDSERNGEELDDNIDGVENDHVENDHVENDHVENDHVENDPIEVSSNKEDDSIPELLQYGDNPPPEYDPEKNDLQQAQDDVDFAKSQQEAYQNSVDAGEVVDDPAVRQQLDDSLEYAEKHLEDVKNGQPYSYEKPSEYWESPEGKQVSGTIFSIGTDFVTREIAKQVGADIPPGESGISNAAKNFGEFYGENFGYKHIGSMADGAQNVMKNAHAFNETSSDRYMKDYFLRDENGTPLTASEAREVVFSNIDSQNDEVVNNELEDNKTENLNNTDERSDLSNYSADENTFDTDYKESSMHSNLNDPNLFENNSPGDYTYESSDSGKKAYGALENSNDGVRDAQAQRKAGGMDRKADDDGGHLIGTRFNGAPDSRNLDAQNSNLNRGSYNHREKTWQDSLNNGDKVYVNVETPRSNGSERPDAYMGYSIIEHPDGTREWDAFSYQNASKAEQEEWNKELAEFDNENPEDYDNPMQEIYDKEDYTDRTE